MKINRFKSANSYGQICVNIICFCFCACLITIPINSRSQQSIQLSQYQFHSAVFNPSYTGVYDALVLVAGYRNQWTGLTGAPKSQVVNFNLPLRRLRSGIGMTLISEALGAEKNVKLFFDYAYHLPFDFGTISMGIKAGFMQKSLDGERLRAPQGDYDFELDHNDPTIPTSKVSDIVPSLTSGLSLSGKRFKLGIAISGLLVNTLNIENQIGTTTILNKPHLTLDAGYAFAISKIEMGPSVLYKTNFIESIIDATVNAKINDVFYLGAGYRGYTKERKDALVTNLAVQIAGTTIGYSFDWGLHTLSLIHI